MKRILLFVFIFTAARLLPQALSSDTLQWADYKKLTWNDFRGDTIDVPGLTGQSMMMMMADFKKAHLFLPATTNVVAVFDRRNSWITAQSRTRATLKYYQVMFDLYEVYSRQLRKEFESTKFGIDPNAAFREKYNAALTALGDRNKLYMKETKLGTDSSAINRWDITISDELKHLEKYRQKK